MRPSERPLSTVKTDRAVDELVDRGPGACCACDVDTRESRARTSEDRDMPPPFVSDHAGQP